MTSGQRNAVRERAGGRCEYCQLPDFALASADFHVEHIIARKHRGDDGAENLAWACIYCNLYKGPNLSSIDPDSGEITRLFHPRRDRWKDHFRLEGSILLGQTAVGRTTVWLLEMNAALLTRLRASLMEEGR